MNKLNQVIIEGTAKGLELCELPGTKGFRMTLEYDEETSVSVMALGRAAEAYWRHFDEGQVVRVIGRLAGVDGKWVLLAEHMETVLQEAAE